MNDTVGQSYARAKKRVRESLGTRVVVSDQATGWPLRAQPYAARKRKLEPRDREFLAGDGAAAGAVRNAAFPDVCVYELTPTDFPTPPSEGDGLTEQGQGYTVIGVPPSEVEAGVPHTLLLVCSRTPPPNAAGADPATGLRPAFFPPAATL